MTSDRFRVAVTDVAGHHRQHALHDRARLAELGIYLGSDPMADIVVDGAELWHAHVIIDNDRLRLEVIAGRLRVGTRELAAGDTCSIDGDILDIAGTRIELDVAPRSDTHDFLMPRRTQEPQPLWEAERLLRLRIERDGRRRVVELGPIARIATPVSVGRDPDCDVVVDDLARRAVTFERRHWQRIPLDARTTIQLCRWPCRDEPVEMLWEPPPPPPPPAPPAPPPPPPPAIELGVTIDDAACLAALLTYIHERPLRMSPSPTLQHALATYTFAPTVQPVFEAWAKHSVGRIDIGELVLGDSFLSTRLPVMIKGELYGEVDVDYSETRTDVIVLGRHAERYVAFRRSSHIDDWPIEIDTGRGTESWSGSLARVVARAVRAAHERGISTDLDPVLRRQYQDRMPNR